ncbi:hypothetical protein HPB49_003124 [Dermacentor silvarum]|uniref:Uncharacterized protein n=1 Tax=Dermacentor silvarum TaxID=543639 RepID=A0ACB8DTN3_DERSI|nr:hypothetical protein HPB49_003124 [Dermacentor silvarum]
MPNREEESPPDSGAASIPPEQEDMDTHTGLANLQAGKRPRDQTNSLATTQDSSGGDEPPPKTPAQPSTPSACPEGERNKQQDAVTSKDQHEPAKGVDSASTGRDTPPDVQPPVSVTESVEECMDVSRDEASSMAGKRAHERTVDSEQQRDDGGGGEPPTKTPATRDGPTLTPLKKHSATTSNAVAAAVEVQREVQPESEGKLEDTTTVSAKTPDNVEPRNPETMDFSQEAAALTAGKRSHEEFVGKKPEPGGGSDEPPPKPQEFGALL